MKSGDHDQDHDDHDHARRGHGHHHHHGTAGRTLGIALVLTPGFSVVEFVAGWRAGSLALLADSGRMVSDGAALASGAINDALKQIESGRLLVEWATSLLRAHGHWNGGACTFFGIVSLKPRRQPRKGTTSRSAELPDPEISRHGGGYPFFTLANHPRAPVVALLRKLESHARNTQGDGR